jgi:hypothetical protein
LSKGPDSGASGTAYHPDAKIYLGDTSAGSASDGEDLVLVTGGTGPGSGSITLRTNGEDVSINNGNVSLANGNLSVASGHGIDFSADSHASGKTSEVLDDYEEGTWTPILSTDGDTTLDNESSTLSTNTYVKIGRMVHITAWAHAWNWSNLPTAGSYVMMRGFPFEPISHDYVTFSYTSNLGASYGYTATGKAGCYLHKGSTNNLNNHLRISDAPTSGDVYCMISATYYTAE